MSEDQNIFEKKFEKENPKSEEVNETISPPETTEQTETQPEAQNTKIETENMEVHHHPKVEKKNFKEYFLEGLMIFLAVMLGFFAENLRESITNHRQVNEYGQSMINDLSSDIIMYNSAIDKNLRYARMIDSIFISLKMHAANSGEVYVMARKLTRGNYVISPNAKTYLQMTSTGGLRLIKHQRVADSIALYYQLTQSFNYWNDLQRQRVNDMIAVNDKLFDATVLYSIARQLSGNDGDSTYLPLNNPPYFSNDPAVINLVLARYQYFYGFLMLMNKRAADGAAQATQLRSMLMKEYGKGND